MRWGWENNNRNDKRDRKWMRMVMGAAAALFISFCADPGMLLHAEEFGGQEDFSDEYDIDGNLSDTTEDFSEFMEDGTNQEMAEEPVPETDSAQKGTYTVSEDWVKADSLSTEEKPVYKQSGRENEEKTSTISCSYMDTNYTVMEYEQLRDMLTNNLVYNNVNAQISASAGYTQNMDYLYILLVDDSNNDYRDIYCYVVGDYRCFCVEVKEYRAEAQELQTAEKDTPETAGKKLAESFSWN